MPKFKNRLGPNLKKTASVQSDQSVHGHRLLFCLKCSPLHSAGASAGALKVACSRCWGHSPETGGDGCHACCTAWLWNHEAVGKKFCLVGADRTAFSFNSSLCSAICMQFRSSAQVIESLFWRLSTKHHYYNWSFLRFEPHSYSKCLPFHKQALTKPLREIN